MLIRKIVVGYDGSGYSKRALEAAIYLAKALEASVTTLTVIQAPEFSPSLDEIDEGYKDAEKMIKPLLDEIKGFGEQNKIEINSVVLRGHPAGSIVKYAFDKKADLIIMGTRGVGGFKSMILGSIAQKVVSYSKVPVMVIK
ncbi:universal stress protein [Candidatus Formimonas warabiya]|uniref:Universal stress protein UspA n=1 Tax=Formimonas warabiya TaxID=1761012 RepID=A0A3G1KRW8_FORW1|nr:universal stress protein [Candidatus Formimonas warabiya]ATW25232.1 universal stress protein UspA [Candidatus Formimonas warabiya]